MFVNRLRKILLSFESYLAFREALREGIKNVILRKYYQRKILSTAAILTDKESDVEVRVLSWRRDYINLIWALKSFYFYSGKNFSLFIHDGGLNKKGFKTLKKHFPNCTIVKKMDADKAVNDYLKKGNYLKSITYRKQNIATLKLFDFFILSKAKRIISIDSDILFFKKPEELIDFDNQRNRYNKDLQFAYSLTTAEIKDYFDIELIPFINSGLFNVSKDIFNCDKIEEWLNCEKLFENKWVTEQTLHALSSNNHKDGVELLPKNYFVSTTKGINEDLICKHYPGFFRPLLYQEGMKFLFGKGFIKKIK